MSAILSILSFIAAALILASDSKHHDSCKSVINPCTEPNLILGLSPDLLALSLIGVAILFAFPALKKIGFIR